MKIRPRADVTYEDLPCWMKLQCAQIKGSDGIKAIRRREAAFDPNCEIDNILDQETGTISKALDTSNVAGIQTVYADTIPDATLRTDLIITKLWMKDLSGAPLPDMVNGVSLADNYIYSQKIDKASENDPIIGTSHVNHFGVHHFGVRLRKGTIPGTTADHSLILDPGYFNYSGPSLIYIPILNTSKPNANSLQLGSFVPGIPSFFYEWWTPSCKPALYFYPKEETELLVKVTPNGRITESIPLHGNQGWKVMVQPDGTIVNLASDMIDSTIYPYLYYEAAVKNVEVPKDKGWIKTSDQLLVFFADVLPKLGLNNQEAKDFIEYWIPKLQSEGNRWFITLINEQEVNRTEPVEFSVQPDNFLRIRFYFENIDNKIFTRPIHFEIINQNSEISREGFTVIDWGGIMGNGSCGVEELVE